MPKMASRAGELVQRSSSEVVHVVPDPGDVLAHAQPSLALQERPLGLLSPVDVHEDGHHVPDASILRPDAAGGDQRPEDRAVLADEPLVEGVAVDLAGQEPVEQGQVGRHVVGMGQLLPGRAGELLSRVPEHRADAVVDLHPALRRAGDGDPDGRGLEVGAQPGLALREPALGSLLDRDVPADGQVSLRPSVRVVERAHAGVDGDLGSVLPALAHHGAARSSPRQARRVGGRIGLGEIRLQEAARSASRASRPRSSRRCAPRPPSRTSPSGPVSTAMTASCMLAQERGREAALLLGAAGARSCPFE